MNDLVIAGGVSANQYIKNALTEFCKNYNYIYCLWVAGSFKGKGIAKWHYLS